MRLYLTMALMAVLAVLVMAQSGSSANKTGTNPPFVQILELQVGDCGSTPTEEAQKIIDAQYLFMASKMDGVRFHMNSDVPILCIEYAPYTIIDARLYVEQELMARGASPANTYVALYAHSDIECASYSVSGTRPLKVLTYDVLTWGCVNGGTDANLAITQWALKYNGYPAGMSTGVVTADEAKIYALNPLFDDSVTTLTEGQGKISSQPASEACPVDCGATMYFQAGSTVTLTATPSPGSHFVRWTGNCSGSSACQLTMNVPSQTVTAVFAPNAPPMGKLVLKITGKGCVTVKRAAMSVKTCNASAGVRKPRVLSLKPGVYTVLVSPAPGWKFCASVAPRTVALSTGSLTRAYAFVRAAQCKK